MRKMIAVALLLGTGCATVWTKPGTTGDDLADAKLKCTAYARMACNGYTRRSCLYDCMVERGWTPEK